MPAARALNATQYEYKSILVPIEGTDPIQYVESYELVQIQTTLDMNNFNSISQYLDEFGVATGETLVLLTNGETLWLKNSYEEVNEKYITYLNGG